MIEFRPNLLHVYSLNSLVPLHSIRNIQVKICICVTSNWNICCNKILLILSIFYKAIDLSEKESLINYKTDSFSLTYLYARYEPESYYKTELK